MHLFKNQHGCEDHLQQLQKDRSYTLDSNHHIIAVNHQYCFDSENEFINKNKTSKQGLLLWRGGLTIVGVGMHGSKTQVFSEQSHRRVFSLGGALPTSNPRTIFVGQHDKLISVVPIRPQRQQLNADVINRPAAQQQLLNDAMIYAKAARTGWWPWPASGN